MTLRDAAGLSCASLIRRPARTLLTILGLGVGVAAVLTVLTLGGAGQTQVEREIARLGVDKVWLTAEAGSDRLLTMADGDQVACAVAAPVCAGAATVAPLFFGEETLPGQALGYDEGYESVYMPQLTAGRLFTQAEYASGAAVALADEALNQAMGGDAVGRRLRVGARWVRVVGAVKGMPAKAAPGAAGTVILPLRTLLEAFSGVEVAEVTVSLSGGRRAEEIGPRAVAALSASGGSFAYTSLQEEIDAARSVIRIFVMVLACVAAVCMLTGAIGVMNVLLISVRERRREIGLIKAIGGTSAQVGLLFLMEAAGYALAGGAAGLLLGAGLIRLFGGWIGLHTALSAGTVLPLLAASALTGVAFGVIPALRASRMQPVDALRSE